MPGSAPPALPGPQGSAQRLFFALPLDAAALDVVARLMSELRAVEAACQPEVTGARAGLRWVRPEGVHLTLRFLGSTARSRTGAAAAALERAAAGVGPFTVRLAGAGAFPRPSAPRVLWLGIAAGADRAAALAARLDEHLVAAGWPAAERPFDAHVTLARGNDMVIARVVVADLVRRAATLDLEWTADRAVLYQSWPGPGGSRFGPVAVVPLTG